MRVSSAVREGSRGERPGDQQSENSVVGGRRRLPARAGDAKVPFEDSYFPRSHGCHTSPAILRLSPHCGNHNYTCGCLLIAPRSIPRPSQHPSRIPASCSAVLHPCESSSMATVSELVIFSIPVHLSTPIRKRYLNRSWKIQVSFQSISLLFHPLSYGGRHLETI